MNYSVAAYKSETLSLTGFHPRFAGMIVTPGLDLLFC